MKNRIIIGVVFFLLLLVLSMSSITLIVFDLDSDADVQVQNGLVCYQFQDGLSVSETVWSTEYEVFENFSIFPSFGPIPFYNDRWYGQNFTIGGNSKNVSFNMTTISAWFFKSGSPSDTVYCHLYTVDSSGLPDVLLGSSSVDVSDVEEGNENAKKYNFSFSPAINLKANTMYAFACNITGGSLSDCIIYRDIGAPNFYPYGGPFSSDDGGSSWNLHKGNDLFFEISGDYSYCSFDNMGFNISTDDDIVVTLRNVVDGANLEFEVDGAGGEVLFNISGWTDNKQMNVRVNDVVEFTPTTSPNGYLVFVDTPNDGDVYRIGANAPSITTNASTNPGHPTYVDMHGYIVDDGSDSDGCTVWFQYCKHNTSYALYGSNTSKQYNKYSGDEISKQQAFSTVYAGERYFYRMVANNSNTTVYGSNLSFILYPMNLTGIIPSIYCNNYTNKLRVSVYTAEDINKTVIRYSTTGFPETPTDGNELINETLNQVDKDIKNFTIGVDWDSTIYLSGWNMAEWDGEFLFSKGTVYGKIDTPKQYQNKILCDDATNVTNTTASLNFNLTDTGQQSNMVWFNYGTTDSYGISSSSVSRSSNETYIVNVSSLSPGTLYYVQAKATNGYSTTVSTEPYNKTMYYSSDRVFRNNPYIPQWVFDYNEDIASNPVPSNVFDGYTDKIIIIWFYDDGGSFRSWSSPSDDTKFDINASTDYDITISENFTFYLYPTETAPFFTNPNPPDSSTIDVDCQTLIFNWNKGTGANTTVIEMNATGLNGTVWGCGDGYEIYNGTGSTYNLLLNTSEPVNYTFQLWSYAQQIDDGVVYSNYSITNESIDVWGGCPDPPYNGSSNFSYYSSGWLNLNWTRGNNSDFEVVVRNNASYPSSPSDGYEVQNGTTNATGVYITWCNISAPTTTCYFTVWSYNSTSGYYSRTGLHIPWGGMAIQVYNESKPHQAITDFDIEIATYDGSQVYTAFDCDNIHYLDVTDLPTGNNVVIRIDADDYYARKYYYDLTTNTFYNYTFYLPPYVFDPPGEGEGDEDNPSTENETIFCVVQVKDETQQIIPAAKVTVKRYISTTDNYETMSIELTDGNGEAVFWLVPNVQYLFNITKDGYVQTGSRFWTPTTVLYVKTFILEFEEEEYTNETDCASGIIFNGHRMSTWLRVNYTDTLEGTTNFTIWVYEVNHTTNLTGVFYAVNQSGVDSYTFNLTTINASNSYYAVLFVVHEECGSFKKQFIFDNNPFGVDGDTLTTVDEFTTLFDYAYGSNPFGWHNTFGLFLVILCLFAFGQRNSGLAVMLCGGLLVFMNVIVGLTLFALTYTTLVIVLGGLMQLRNQRRENGRGGV